MDDFKERNKECVVWEKKWEKLALNFDRILDVSGN